MKGLLPRIGIILALVTLLNSGCSYRFLFWERNIWQDLHGIFAIGAPDDLDLYRQLLPKQFSAPEEPMVGLFVVDYVDTEPWPITPTKFLRPYLESAIFLRCHHKGQTGWYCAYMAVSTETAKIGGRRLGFPKFVADRMTLDRTDDGWIGSTVHDGTARMRMHFVTTPLRAIDDLSAFQEEFMQGRGAAELKGPIFLLIPPSEGPDVNVLPCSPPPLVARETGLVTIDLVEPYNGLIALGTVSPGLYQRFTVGSENGPSGLLTLLFLAFLASLAAFLVRAVRKRRAR